MRSILLFAGSHHYPGGGWRDFVSDHDTEEGALIAGKSHVFVRNPRDHDVWFMVVDTRRSSERIVLKASRHGHANPWIVYRIHPDGSETKE